MDTYHESKEPGGMVHSFVGQFSDHETYSLLHPDIQEGIFIFKASI